MHTSRDAWVKSKISATSKRLQLNPDKTEIMWLGSKVNLKADRLGPFEIKPPTSVRDLCVKLDSILTLHDHIWRTASSCFVHLHRLRQLLGAVCRSTMQRFVSALVLSSLDYCNAVLAGLPSTILDPLRRVLSCISSRRCSWSSEPCDRTDEGASSVTNQIAYQFQVVRRCKPL